MKLTLHRDEKNSSTIKKQQGMDKTTSAIPSTPTIHERFQSFAYIWFCIGYQDEIRKHSKNLRKFIKIIFSGYEITSQLH